MSGELTKIIELQQERHAIAAQMREVIDTADAEKRGLNVEEKTKYDALEADLESKAERIKLEQDMLAREEELARRTADFDPAKTQPTNGDAEDRHFTATPEYRRAFVNYVRSGLVELAPEDRKILQAGRDEVRDQSKSSNTLGGYLVPIDFQKKLALHAVQAGTFRRNRAGEIAIVTDAGEPLQLPKTTVYGSAHWVAEGNALSPDDSSFGQITLTPQLVARLVKVSIQLLEDNAVNLEDHLSRAIGQSIGRTENTAYWVGTGTGQPTGLITSLQSIGAAAIGKTGATGQTTSITADDILDLYYSVGPQYRDNGEWTLNDLTVKAVRKLKTANGDYLWSVAPGTGGSLAYAPPDTLQGRPLWSDPDVPVMAASAYSVIFGDMQAYRIRDVGQTGPDASERPLGAFSVVRLDQRYMDTLEIGFLGWHRTDGNLIDQTGAVKAYVNSAT